MATATFLVAACGTTPPPAIGPTVIQPATGMGQDSYSSAAPTLYRLRGTDKISVVVYREPDLSLEEVAIALDGTVGLPLLGAVQAAGLTTNELAEDIELRLRAAGVKDPQVSLNLTSAASHRVTVEGGVEDPGVYTFQPGDRLSAALALADGPTRVANLKEVAIFREGEGGISVAKFDYRSVSQGTMIDPVLEPGDRVVVGLSGLSQFWQDFLRALPAFGLFTNVNW
ncbi:polysaccharide export protein [Altererythrobacter arenosus]|uniref:Polysaccharide export protein n=1 Tax=Altererythrobacter arenosus TaxID=3032592 RepID=A0ABY8FLT0_9SPHN|nr:polysaccharide biosynthesis/export family protein [Altererythrobacter sp. CAU 1644]WFL75972.1 polysaccharide export protein [Altererythrobacter sp. CAU 1644]